MDHFIEMEIKEENVDNSDNIEPNEDGTKEKSGAEADLVEVPRPIQVSIKCEMINDKELDNDRILTNVNIPISNTHLLVEVKQETDGGSNIRLADGGDDNPPIEKDLQEEVVIKQEIEDGCPDNGMVYDEMTEDLQIKLEPDIVCNTALFTDNIVKIGNAQEPLIRIQYEPTPNMFNAEAILPNTMDTCFNDTFQLNSITSDMAPLEQQAFGLLEAKNHNASYNMKQNDSHIQCPKCPKICTTKRFKYHLEVHKVVERRAEAVLRGIQTKAKKRESRLLERSYVVYSEQSGLGNFNCSVCNKSYQMKKSLLKHQRHCVNSDNDYGKGDFQCTKCGKVYNFKRCLKSHEKVCLIKGTVSVVPKDTYQRALEGGGEYLCPCGKAYHRRSRMETCLRSHNLADEQTRNHFSCLACSKVFNNKIDLANHRKKHHLRKPYPCKFCPTDYQSPKQLFKHLRRHQKVQLMEYKVISEIVKGENQLNCFMCNKTCKELSELKSHVMGDHQEPYKCPQCNDNFPNIIDFASHTKAFHPEVEGQSVLDVLEAFSKLAESWKCEECDLQFDQPDNLAMHQLEQHSVYFKSEVTSPQFQCNDCSRVFVTAKRLSTHRRMIHNHTDGPDGVVEAPFDPSLMCIHCRKVCKDDAALTSHMRLHSPERKYVCKFCDFRFATLEKRKTHSLIHTGDMKYVCFVCEYRCSSENRLSLHKVSAKHLRIKESLLTGASLLPTDGAPAKKVCTEIEGDTTCSVCGESFESEANMLDHKQTHPFIEICNEDKSTKIFFK